MAAEIIRSDHIIVVLVVCISTICYQLVPVGLMPSRNLDSDQTGWRLFVLVSSFTFSVFCHVWQSTLTTPLAFQ